jgi:hypothetical protein
MKLTTEGDRLRGGVRPPPEKWTASAAGSGVEARAARLLLGARELAGPSEVARARVQARLSRRREAARVSRIPALVVMGVVLALSGVVAVAQGGWRMLLPSAKRSLVRPGPVARPAPPHWMAAPARRLSEPEPEATAPDGDPPPSVAVVGEPARPTPARARLALATPRPTTVIRKGAQAPERQEARAVAPAADERPVPVPPERVAAEGPAPELEQATAAAAATPPVALPDSRPAAIAREQAATPSREAEALASALAALRAGAPARALDAVASYRRAFPGGALEQEAFALEVEADLALGRRATALHLLEGMPLDGQPRARELHLLRAELRADARRCAGARDDLAAIAAATTPAWRQRIEAVEARCP